MNTDITIYFTSQKFYMFIMNKSWKKWDSLIRYCHLSDQIQCFSSCRRTDSFPEKPLPHLVLLDFFLIKWGFLLLFSSLFFFFLIKSPLLVLLPWWLRSVENGRGTRRGYRHNIPFTSIHRTKHRITITVRSWQHGKGQEQVASRDVIKKTQALSKTGLFQPKRIRRSEAIWEGQTVRGGGEGRFRGWVALWQLGEGNALPLLGSL